MTGKKLWNFWKKGIPVELGRPLAGRVVLRPVRPEECVRGDSAIEIPAGFSGDLVYEVLSVGEGVSSVRPGQIVLPVFEALRTAGADHLVCAEEELVVVWDREALEEEEREDDTTKEG